MRLSAEKYAIACARIPQYKVHKFYVQILHTEIYIFILFIL